MEEEKLKSGDLVIYKGGLFPVEKVGNKYCRIGEITVRIDEVQKADWRDINRIMKGNRK